MSDTDERGEKRRTQIGCLRCPQIRSMGTGPDKEEKTSKMHNTVDLRSVSGGRICRSPAYPSRKVKCRERRVEKGEAATALKE